MANILHRTTKLRTPAIDPSLRGWVCVVMTGMDALVGRIVDTDDTKSALVAENVIREELLGNKTPTVTLTPVYAFGVLVFNAGAPGVLVPHTVERLQRLERTLGLPRARGVETHVTLNVFQFCAEWPEVERRRLVARIEEADRAHHTAVHGLVALDS